MLYPELPAHASMLSSHTQAHPHAYTYAHTCTRARLHPCPHALTSAHFARLRPFTSAPHIAYLVSTWYYLIESASTPSLNFVNPPATGSLVSDAHSPTYLPACSLAYTRTYAPIDTRQKAQNTEWDKISAHTGIPSFIRFLPQSLQQQQKLNCC